MDASKPNGISGWPVFDHGKLFRKSIQLVSNNKFFSWFPYLSKKNIMAKSLNAVNVFCVVLGIFLLIEGGWGLFSPITFGVFSTNPLHAIIHLVLGTAGIFYGLRNRARNFSFFIGILIVIVGVFYFVPVVGAFITKILNLNQAVAIFNIVVGIAAILFAYMTPKRQVTSNTQ